MNAYAVLVGNPEGKRPIGIFVFEWEDNRGPLSLVSTIEELLERKSRGSGLENREYGSRHQQR
jgi:hypothetical protein